MSAAAATGHPEGGDARTDVRSTAGLADAGFDSLFYWI